MITNVDTYERVFDEGVNANAESTTTPITTRNAKNIGVFVKLMTGTGTTFVSTLQVFDGVNWWDTDHIIHGEGNFHEDICVGEQLRVKITTSEGSTSTVDITIIIK